MRKTSMAMVAALGLAACSDNSGSKAKADELPPIIGKWQMESGKIAIAFQKNGTLLTPKGNGTWQARPHEEPGEGFIGVISLALPGLNPTVCSYKFEANHLKFAGPNCDQALIKDTDTAAFIRVGDAPDTAETASADNTTDTPAAITSEKIVGQWESPSWKAGDQPVFVRFKGDGTLDFNGTIKWVNKGEWLLLESGQLQVITGGETRRCDIAYDGKTMNLSPASCFKGWEDMGDSISLEKQ
ncbi:hypothetical protein QA648_36865 (plasmid) [Rhizobium sp. CB3171]|uniref:hypothetical protein n=1 Tax=Rhizobium sp. CB3171 TaxID=3039157 RepID=UPI0024B0E341|nr:hypothetical protein [Rhizobium sp. CB3171]WFU07552.1 hypothetical protein QA648_36865 [Rhizobium sp. CB3171]